MLQYNLHKNLQKAQKDQAKLQHKALSKYKFTYLSCFLEYTQKCVTLPFSSQKFRKEDSIFRREKIQFLQSGLQRVMLHFRICLDNHAEPSLLVTMVCSHHNIAAAEEAPIILSRFYVRLKSLKQKISGQSSIKFYYF